MRSSPQVDRTSHLNWIEFSYACEPPPEVHPEWFVNYLCPCPDSLRKVKCSQSPMQSASTDRWTCPFLPFWRSTDLKELTSCMNVAELAWSTCGLRTWWKTSGHLPGPKNWQGHISWLCRARPPVPVTFFELREYHDCELCKEFNWATPVYWSCIRSCSHFAQFSKDCNPEYQSSFPESVNLVQSAYQDPATFDRFHVFLPQMEFQYLWRNCAVYPPHSDGTNMQ